MQVVASCTATPIPVTIQEAMVEAAIKARNIGCKQILFLCDNQSPVQVINGRCTPNWQERFLMADWAYLAQNDTNYHALFVPKLVNSSVNKT